MQLIQPASSRNYKQFAFLCAIGSIWLVCNFYTALHVLPALQGTGPLLQGTGAPGNSDYPLKVQELLSSYGFRDAPTPVFVIYSRIILRFCFWSLAAIFLWKYSSRLERINDAFRLLGTLGLGLLLIDEAVSLQVRDEAYRQAFAGSFATSGQIAEMVVIGIILLLLLTPWYRLIYRRKSQKMS